MVELTDAEYEAMLRGQYAMPTVGSGNAASFAPAVRARPKKCYYCGRADGTHIGGCDVKPTDEQVREAEREQARRDAIRAAAKPIDLSAFAFELDRLHFPLKLISARPIMKP